MTSPVCLLDGDERCSTAGHGWHDAIPLLDCHLLQHLWVLVQCFTTQGHSFGISLGYLDVGFGINHTLTRFGFGLADFVLDALPASWRSSHPESSGASENRPDW
jgi:hypothetical protein